MIVVKGLNYQGKKYILKIKVKPSKNLKKALD